VPTIATLDVVIAAPTFPEAEVGDMVQVSCDALEANIGFVGAWVHAAGGVTFRLMNPTAAGINPASHTYKVQITKPGPTF